jgi:hypothetical protein
MQEFMATLAGRQGERNGLIRELNAVTNDVSGVRRLLARMGELQGARARLTDDVRQARLRLDAEALRMLLRAGAATVTLTTPATYSLKLATNCDLPEVKGEELVVMLCWFS